MFASLPTLHNCFMFGNISKEIELARMLHYNDEEHNVTTNNVGRILTDCLINYCKTLPGCDEAYHESYSNYPPLRFRGDPNDTSSRQQLVDSICDNVPVRINSDVGGIGVSNSGAH